MIRELQDSDGRIIKAYCPDRAGEQQLVRVSDKDHPEYGKMFAACSEDFYIIVPDNPLIEIEKSSTTEDLFSEWRNRNRI